MNDQQGGAPIAGEEAEQMAALERIAAEAETGGQADDYIPGSTAPAEPEDNSGAELWGAVYLMAFGIASSRAGDHWALSVGEAEELGKATDKVAEKYMPGFRMGPEAALVTCAIAVLMPRMMVHKQKAIEAERKARQERQDSEGGAGGDQ